MDRKTASTAATVASLSGDDARAQYNTWVRRTWGFPGLPRGTKAQVSRDTLARLLASLKRAGIDPG